MFGGHLVEKCHDAPHVPLICDYVQHEEIWNPEMRLVDVLCRYRSVRQNLFQVAALPKFDRATGI